MKTTAYKIGDLADQDGSEVPKKFDEALGFAPLFWRFSNDADSPIRYEFADGSAIVIAGNSWDYGVHANKLEGARNRYKPEDNVPVEFAWTGAGYGLTEDDALPRERGKKVMPFVKIMSDADAQAFIAANPGALWFLSKALCVEDVKYRLQEIRTDENKLDLGGCE